MGEAADYKSSGVDVVSGDEASSIFYEAAQKTWRNRSGKLGEVIGMQDHFRTVRYFQPQIPGICFGLNADGIGTKIELAERLHSYGGLARDLLAMVCDDAAVQGAEPIHITTILDIAKMDLLVVRDLADGLVSACAEAGVAVLNGETAELPGRVSGYSQSAFNWGATCLWGAQQSKLTAWTRPRAGDVIVGVQERGFRSNGFSLIRSIFRRSFGDAWGTGSGTPSIDLIRFALRPSTIYTPLILSLTGGLYGPMLPGLRACVHVTGGGLAGRTKFFCRVNQVGATISVPSALGPPEPMCEICELGSVALEEAYHTWNMGIGMLVVTAPEAVAEVIARTDALGLTAAVIGALTDEPLVSLTVYDGTSFLFSP